MSNCRYEQAQPVVAGRSGVLILSIVASSNERVAWGQAPARFATTPELYGFMVAPSKQFYSLGETVASCRCALTVNRNRRLLVNRRWGEEFVRFRLLGPDGNEVPWQSKAGGIPQANTPPLISTVHWGNIRKSHANRIISAEKDGTGFVFEKPGQYTLTAEFSMGPPENFAPF